MEFLDRGLIALKQSDREVFLSWRLLITDPSDLAFNIYRQTGKNSPIKLNNKPLTAGTCFKDSLADMSQANSWYLTLIVKKKETRAGKNVSLKANALKRPYLSIPITPPPGETLDGGAYTYSANDGSAADLDGDGEYEIILKWDPSNSKNPPQTGLTGSQIIDAYKLDGTRLWRIDLGRNIRSGAAYTQFLVYDMDGDGRAEMITKTADGSIDGTGVVIGAADKDWRTLGAANSPTFGKVITGPEYITVFDGLTGKALATSDFIPGRDPLDGWGGIGGNGGNDNTGGRPDRFTAGVAYLDGKRPSAFYVRGWYGRTVIAAWDWREGKLTSRWVFDSKDGKNPYSGMANHSISVADVDADGKDEICVGAMTVDDNGKGLYTTGLRHGDALHVTDMDPTRPGLEVFGVHETEEKTASFRSPGVALFEASNGKIIFSQSPAVDVGRGVAADIDPRHVGFENWGGPGGLRNLNGKTISEKTPSSTNFLVWWDDDLTRELLDKNRIDKWDWVNESTVNLLNADSCVSNNGTKATPVLSADLFGDWREEVIWRRADNRELRIYSSTIPSSRRFTTFMHDPQYRLSIAWQNVSYNQPPHPGFYFGEGYKGHKPTAVYLVNRAEKLITASASVKKRLIFQDNFTNAETSAWIKEIDPQENSSVSTKAGKMTLDTKGGVTVWLNKKFKGNLQIEYTRKITDAGGLNDRISDLNQFWMASDPKNVNLFRRSGKLEEYDSLSMYYVGMGGNYNSTTRFRKYDGTTGERKLIQEYTDPDHLLVANKEYHIKTIVKDGITSFWVDGKCFFIYEDPQPLREGYFGIRSTKSRQEISNVKIYQLD